jgi:cytidine deaminase
VTVRTTCRVAGSMASYHAKVNGFCPDAILARHRFPVDIFNREAHVKAPVTLKDVEGRLFRFRDKPRARIYQSDPVRVYFVHNISGKWLFWGRIVIESQTIRKKFEQDGTWKGEWITDGEYRVIDVYDSVYQETFTRREAPPRKQLFRIGEEPMSELIPRQLIEAAIRALEFSHPRNPPNLRFGAAVLTSSGAVYAASAFWSDTLTLAIHAEHAALVHAAIHGDRNVEAIACVSTEDPEGNEHCHPCGLCRQVIYENGRESRRDITVYMANLRGAHIAKTISELMAYPWPPDRR